MVTNDLSLLPIRLCATPEQKAKFISPIAARGAVASFASTEPGAGSDAGGIQTTIKRDGNHYVVNGSKQWITNGGFAEQFTVFGTIDKTKKHKGVTCVVVPGDAPGIKRGSHEDKLGQRCSNTVSLTFDNVRVPIENRIGEEGEGFRVAMKTLDASRPMTAIIAVGIARAAFEHAKSYAKERKQLELQLVASKRYRFSLLIWRLKLMLRVFSLFDLLPCSIRD